MNNSLLGIINEVQGKFSVGEENTEELFEVVKNLLPLDEVGYKIVNVERCKESFKTSVDCKLASRNECEVFVESYSLQNNETLRVRTPAFPKGKSEFACILYYRCHHRTTHDPSFDVARKKQAQPSKILKNTNCPFNLILKLRKLQVEPLEFPCRLEISWNHNHSVQGLQSLSFRDIPKHVSERIWKLFDEGLTPSLAYKEFIDRVKKDATNELEFHQNLADRAIVPKRHDFNTLFTKYKIHKYGSKDLPSMFATLKKNAEQLVSQDPDYKIQIQTFDCESNDPFILAVVSPLMKRVHSRIPTSKEIVFLDSSSGMEEFNLRVFVMVTHSPVGALPLGIFITSDETLTIIKQAFDLLKLCLPDDAFFGRKILGPIIFMTDNCTELRDALTYAWPASKLLLCIFHLIQQVWRWLFETRHTIKNDDRPTIITCFRKIVFASDEESMEEAYDDMINSETVSRYPHFLEYLASLYNIGETWALCYRKDLPIRGSNTNNSIEAQFLVIKDEILNRTKNININGLLLKLTDDFMLHFKVKLLNVASGKFDGVYRPRFKGIGKKKGEGIGFKMPTEQEEVKMLAGVHKIAEGVFMINSTTKDDISYHVDTNIGICECFVGQTGSVCKHQYTLWIHYKAGATNFLPMQIGSLSALERKKYAEIAIGSSLPVEYYEGVHDRLCTDVPQSCSVDISNDDVATDFNITPCNAFKSVSQRSTVERVSVDECKDELQSTMHKLQEHLDTNPNNYNFVLGLMKFCERAKKYPVSRLESALHNFGNEPSTSLRVTQTSTMKKMRKGKIYVQPEAVKRRKHKDGSRKAKVKGMCVKKNQLKRRHSLVDNVLIMSLYQKKLGEQCFRKLD